MGTAFTRQRSCARPLTGHPSVAYNSPNHTRNPNIMINNSFYTLIGLLESTERIIVASAPSSSSDAKDCAEASVMLQHAKTLGSIRQRLLDAEAELFRHVHQYATKECDPPAAMADFHNTVGQLSGELVSTMYQVQSYDRWFRNILQKILKFLARLVGPTEGGGGGGSSTSWPPSPSSSSSSSSSSSRPRAG